MRGRQTGATQHAGGASKNILDRTVQPSHVRAGVGAVSHDVCVDPGVSSNLESGVEVARR